MSPTAPSAATPWWTLCEPVCTEAGLTAETVPLRVITDAIKAYVSEVARLKVRARTDRASGNLHLTLARRARPDEAQLARLREAIGPASKDSMWQRYGYVAVDWWATALPSGYEDHPSWPVMVPEAHAETARRCLLERLAMAFPERFRAQDTPSTVTARRWLEAHAHQLRRVARVLGRDAVLAVLEPGRTP